MAATACVPWPADNAIRRRLLSIPVQTQALAKGSKQQATQDQAAALAALNEWVAQYLRIARVALRNKQQLLEKIGGAARPRRTAAQRTALKKTV